MILNRQTIRRMTNGSTIVTDSGSTSSAGSSRGSSTETKTKSAVSRTNSNYQAIALVWSSAKCWRLNQNGSHSIYIYYHTLCKDQWFTAYQEAAGIKYSVGDIIVYNAAYDIKGSFFSEGRFGVSKADNFLAYVGDSSLIEAVNSLQGKDIVALFDAVAIPSAASCTGKRITIKNCGTASADHKAVLCVYAVSSQFYDYIYDYPTVEKEHLYDHISLNQGETVELWSDGAYWIKL